MTVLVVEDDADIREALSDSLVERGFSVLSAHDGRAALDTLERGQPDVILLDLLMGDVDGWTFRREQRQRASVAGIPVVVMTALNHYREEGLDAEAILTKPFTIEEVLAAIAQAVGRRNDVATASLHTRFQ